MPIRLRLALVGAGVAGLALLIFGLLFDRLVVVGVPEDQDRHLSDLAERTVAAVLTAAPDQLVPADGASSPPLLAEVASSTDPFVAVIDGDGAVLTGSADVAALVDELPSTLTDEAERSGGIEATVDPDHGPEVRLQLRRWIRTDTGQDGFVIAGQATAFADEQLSASRLFLAVSGVIALTAATFAAYVATGRALRPLKELAATADEIGRTGDLSRRLPPGRSQDVVGRLTQSFNSMLGRLGFVQGRLSDTVEAQRRFLADASHELRSPLTSIRSNAGFLVQHPDATAGDRDDAAADIATESERMSRLVDGLLTLARADAEPARAVRTVDLVGAVDEVVQRFRRRRLPVTLRADQPAIVAGDPDELRQLAAILVDNATTHGDGEVSVDVWSSDRRVTLTVSDHGSGIDRADLDRIFDRFVRAGAPSRTGRAAPGAGLGLAIARSIVEGHGGTIRAGNRDGGGAVFVVDLPAVG